MVDKKFSNEIGKVVSIKWFDACEDDIQAKIIDRAEDDGLSLLAINTTYGYFYKEFKKVVVLLIEESTHNKEDSFVFIPKDWIIDIK